ncbi:MAG: 2-oxoglutarate dehydrogenase complex dihydrolipoyllysine-residue succinyltransferase [Verrucomicrobiota bacterium]
MNIKVPSVGESITSGILGAWKVSDGGYAKSGETILEIETDKVTSEVYAEASGAVKHLAKEGEEVQVGQVIGEIDTSAKAPAAAAKKETAPAEEKKEAPPEPVAEPAPAPTPAPAATPLAAAPALVSALSPAVRRLVEEHHLNPAQIPASGKGGRILKSDVLAFIENGNGASTPPASSPSTPSTPLSAPAATPAITGDRVTVTTMSPLRKKIAARLVSAQHQAAMLTTFNEVDLTVVMALRKKYQDAFVKKHEVKLGFMSLFTKAVIYALKQVPGINARIDGDRLITNHYYDIGVAMSTPRGLMVPVVRDCDQLTLDGIEKEIIAYGQKAKAGKIQLTDMEGGVFTITNGGIFGSMLSTPILNPPQSAILGMHTIQERPVAINGQVVIRPMMYLALTYDHRIVDGKEAVTFLVRVKEWLENPGVELLGL